MVTSEVVDQTLQVGWACHLAQGLKAAVGSDGAKLEAVEKRDSWSKEMSSL